MRWYRYHQRVVAMLALFALGLQLAVSFAHVHLDGLRLSSAVAASGAASPGRVPTLPLDAPGAPHHDCAICVAVGLLGTALSGEPPAIPPPDFVWFAPLPRVDAARISVARFYAFRTRAPPVA